MGFCKQDGKSSRRKTAVRPSLETEDIIHLLHGSDPIKVELNRLENEVRDKDRELCEAHAEIKALRQTERLKEKAVEELFDEREKLQEKLKAMEIALENKNLDLKRTNDERKSALAAQAAAEATLRRLHASQKDEDLLPLEAILAPVEAELKSTRNDFLKLQDDNKALDRLTKSKEAALLEAERAVQIAEAKASLVDDLQNRNQELLKQIEICQEENKILDKMHRQKVAEVEKLSTTVAELEEALLAGGAAANAARDFERQVHHLMEEKRTLERELARAKVTANRVAVVVANEWKDANDKVMPVKQWLEERRFMQGEMQQLRDKLATTERTARSEAQLKEKLQVRLKVLEEGLRTSTNGSTRKHDDFLRSGTNGASVRRQSTGGSDIGNGVARRRPSMSSASQMRGSVSGSTILKNGKFGSKAFDGSKSLDAGRFKAYANGCEEPRKVSSAASGAGGGGGGGGGGGDVKPEAGKVEGATVAAADDNVSVLFYDMLQKEVVTLRKLGHEKDQSLKDKDDAIEMLSKKVDTLTKAMEVEAKKMRREVAAMEKEVAAMRVDKEQENRARRLSIAKGSVNSSHASSR
ncbi:hypothetical protein SELMODRAFT_113465 [Selaginella moellendorffii]|uniref:Uncharacterized protein n=2 Tax=Selaginella moellendorffii TaxID=88036 RepID=D8SBS2_SELML|nr:hypothetical protein SELMODRAFT_113465 [Selaginella moellendorffii]